MSRAPTFSPAPVSATVDPGRGHAGIGSAASAQGQPFWQLFSEPGQSAGGGGGGKAFADRIAHGASFIVEVVGADASFDSTCLVRFRCGFDAGRWEYFLLLNTCV